MGGEAAGMVAAGEMVVEVAGEAAGEVAPS